MTPIFLLALVLAHTMTDVRARDNAFVLNVRPVLCITDSRNDSCEMSFLVDWRSEVEGDYCLYNDFGTTPIGCWAQEKSGRVEEFRTVDAPFRYWMTNGSSDLRLVEATVDVVSTDIEDRRRNRRKRHAWSIL